MGLKREGDNDKEHLSTSLRLGAGKDFYKLKTFTSNEKVSRYGGARGKSSHRCWWTDLNLFHTGTNKGTYSRSSQDGFSSSRASDAKCRSSRSADV